MLSKWASLNVEESKWVSWYVDDRQLVDVRSGSTSTVVARLSPVPEEWGPVKEEAEEAARELEDLFPDSKLWQRPPFESELEAVWVW